MVISGLSEEKFKFGGTIYETDNQKIHALKQSLYHYQMSMAHPDSEKPPYY